MIDTIPLPATDDPHDAPFWSAALRSQLVVQSCDKCARLRFPPRPVCPYCQSTAHQWRVLSGAATVWSYAKPSSPLLPAFEALTPYVVVLAQIDEDPSIGAPLRVAFRQYAPDVALPCWTLLGEAVGE